MLRGGRYQEWVDHMTVGFFKADESSPADLDELKKWPDEMRAGYFFRKGPDLDDFDPDKKELRLVEKIKGIWDQWEKMEGENAPLERSLAGELRDFDINLDGTAHYGMLPDLLQDIRNTGLAPEDFVPLFRSAYDYVQMWETCTRRAAGLGGGSKNGL